MATTFTAEVRGYEKVVAEYSKVQKEVTKLREEIKRLNDGTAQVGDAHKKAGDASKKHFDIMAQGRQEIMNLVGSYTSVAGAMRIVGDVARYMSEETQKAVTSMKGIQPIEAQMSQVSKGADDLAQMNQEADRLAKTYGESRTGTREALVQGRNLGVATSDIEQMAKFGDIAPLALQAKMGGQVSQLFGGKISPMEAVSMAMRAAEPSAADFGDFAQALPIASEGGKMMGASPEATYATFSALTSQFASPRTAADRVKAMAGKIGKAQEGGMSWLSGLDMPEAIKEIEKRGAAGDIFKEDMESRAGFNAALQQMSMIEDIRAGGRAEISTMRGGGESFIAGKYRGRFDESTATTDLGRKEVQKQLALERQRQAEIGREIANEEQFGMSGIGQQTGRDVVLGGMKARGSSLVQQYGAEKAAGAATLLGAGERGTIAAAEAGGVVAPAGLSFLFGPLGAIQAATEGMRRNMEKPSVGTSALNAATLGGQQQR